MSSICSVVVTIILILGLPISVIWLIVFAIKKKKIKKPLISIATCVVAIMLFTAVGTVSWTKTDDYQEYLTEKEEFERAEQEKQKEKQESSQEEVVGKEGQEESKKESLAKKTAQQNLEVDSKEESDSEQQVVETEKSITDAEKNEQKNGMDVSELSEEEYKSMCEELWHDDIFFSEDSLQGKYVKLDLFVEESRFFKVDAVYDTIASEMIKKHNLKREFFYCGVQRKDEYSYIGGQVSLYFSDNYDLEPSNISVGDHLIVWGEIIDYATNYKTGYNYCDIIPRYIENNGQ